MNYKWANYLTLQFDNTVRITVDVYSFLRVVEYNHCNYITYKSSSCYIVSSLIQRLGSQVNLLLERNPPWAVKDIFHWLLCVLLQGETLIQLAIAKQCLPSPSMIGWRRTSIKNVRRCVAVASDDPDGPRKHRCLFHILLAIKTAEGQATLMETWNTVSAYFSPAPSVSGRGVSFRFLLLILLGCGFDSWRCLLLQADKFLPRLANTTGASSLHLPKY